MDLPNQLAIDSILYMVQILYSIVKNVKTPHKQIDQFLNKNQSKM